MFKKRHYNRWRKMTLLAAILGFTATGLFGQGIPPIDRNVPSPLKKATFALG